MNIKTSCESLLTPLTLFNGQYNVFNLMIRLLMILLRSNNLSNSPSIDVKQKKVLYITTKNDKLICIVRNKNKEVCLKEVDIK